MVNKPTMKKVLLAFALVLGISLAQAQNPYPIRPLEMVQYANDAKLFANPSIDSSDYVHPIFMDSVYRDTVRFEGYVLFDPRKYGLSTSRKATVLQADTIARPWGGVEIMCEPAGTGRNLATLLNETKFYDNLKPGTKVRVTGVIRHFRGGGSPWPGKSGQSQINMIAANPEWENGVEILDLDPKQIRPAVITCDSLMTGNNNTTPLINRQGEKWEGVYVELRNVTVFTRAANGASRWSWSVADANGNAVDMGDFSGWFRNDNLSADTLPVGRFTPPFLGTRLSYVRGVVIENFFGNAVRYTLAPLIPSDIGPVLYTPPIPSTVTRIPTVANTTDSVFVTIKTIQGERPIKSATLFYGEGLTNTTFTSVDMSRNTLPNDTMVFFAKIPPFAAGTLVRHYIRLADINDTMNTTRDTGIYMVFNGGPASIKDLQFSVTRTNTSIWNGDSLSGISIPAIVTSTNMAQGTINILTLQTENTNDSNTAIIVNRTLGDGTTGWKVGDKVNITNCRVAEQFGMTTLNGVAGTVVSSGNALPPAKTGLSLDEMAAISAVGQRRWELTPFEGMLLRFDSVTVIKKNADGSDQDAGFGEFLINTNPAALSGLRVDDIAASLPDGFNVNLRVGQKMTKAQGVLYLSFSNWKLQPRDSNDLDFSDQGDTTRPVITLLGNNPDSLILNGTYVDPGFTALDNIDGDLTSAVTVTSFVDSSKVNTYAILYSVKDAAGNMGSAIRSVVVYLPVGINSNELSSALAMVYPNPAGEEITISVSGVKTLPLEISLMDISGRTLETRSFTGNSVETKFNTSNLESGVYFCRLANANGFRTVKFVVSH